MNFKKAKEVAELFNVDRQTIINWVNKGVLPSKREGRMIYVDVDAVECLAPTMQEVERARLEMLREKEEYEREARHSRELTQGIIFNREREQYVVAAINIGTRTRFIDVILSLLQMNDSINDRETYILRKLLYGASLEEVAGYLGLNRERIRQIVERAFRKCNDLAILEKKLLDAEKKDEDIEAMKHEVISLREKLKRFEKIDAEERMLANMTPDERRLYEKKNSALYKLLSKRLADFNLSVRALNCCKANDVNTVADLVKCHRDDLMKMRNFGKKSFTELEDFLDDNGLEFGMDIDELMTEHVNKLIR